jgi:prepilin-type processing-associated H-X9-DG protein
LIQGSRFASANAQGGWQGVMSYWEGCLYQHEYTPNSSSADWLRTGWCGIPTPETPCIETYSGGGDTKLILTARSRHPGGVNVGMCDGSVQFISNSITLAVWQALGNPNDGVIISANSY